MWTVSCHHPFISYVVCDRAIPYHLCFSILLSNRYSGELFMTLLFVVLPCQSPRYLIHWISICSRSNYWHIQMIWSACFTTQTTWSFYIPTLKYILALQMPRSAFIKLWLSLIIWCTYMCFGYLAIFLPRSSYYTLARLLVHFASHVSRLSIV